MWKGHEKTKEEKMELWLSNPYFFVSQKRGESRSIDRALRMAVDREMVGRRKNQK